MNQRVTTRCDHNHDGDPVQQLTCALRSQVIEQVGPDSTVGVIVLHENGRSFSAYSNMGGFANMVHAMCEFAAKQGRPTSCPTCVEAYDRLMETLALMRTVPRNC